MILEGLLAFILSKRRLVKRNGAKWFTANVYSILSTVVTRLERNTPALLIRILRFP